MYSPKVGDSLDDLDTAMHGAPDARMIVDEHIAKVLGGNTLRVLKEVW